MPPLCRAASDPQFDSTCEQGSLVYQEQHTHASKVLIQRSVATRKPIIFVSVYALFALMPGLLLIYDNDVATIVSIPSAS